MKALIVGNGSVGKQLHVILELRGDSSTFFARSDDPEAFAKALKDEKPDIVYICISTKDKGEAELTYLLACVDHHVPVVTCAKGAIAYRFSALQYYLGTRIGYMATVGGRSKILSLFNQVPASEIDSIASIQNGTLNYLCWAIQEGRTPEEALMEAQKFGITEPGAVTFQQVLQNESLDSLLKAVITYNLSQVGGIVHPDQFSTASMEPSYTQTLMKERFCRFVMEIGNVGRQPFDFEVFHLNPRPWVITGKFVRHAHKILHGMDIVKEQNAMLVKSKAGLHKFKSGEGAGPMVTAYTLVNDAQELLFCQR